MNNAALSYIEKLIRKSPADNHGLELVPWLRVQLENIHSDESSIVTALNGGINSADLSEAFAVGYQAAIHSLAPGLAPDKVYALCVTEEKGGSPKVMETRLDKVGGQLVLNGMKSFVSMGNKAEELLVLAVSGSSQGQKEFSLVKIASTQEGVNLVPFDKELPFVPRMPHASVVLENVKVSDHMLFEGEGYLDYVVHFRPIEDIHVFSAIVGYLWKISRRYEWSSSLQEQLSGLIFTLVNYQFDKPIPPVVDLINAGLFAQLHSLLELSQAEWDKVDVEVADCWRRDMAVLNIAGVVREKRKEKSWSILS